MFFDLEIADRISTDTVIVECRSVTTMVLWFDTSRTLINDDRLEDLTKKICLDSGGGISFNRKKDHIVMETNPVMTYADYSVEEACKQVAQLLLDSRVDTSN